VKFTAAAMAAASTNVVTTPALEILRIS